MEPRRRVLPRARWMGTGGSHCLPKAADACWLRAVVAVVVDALWSGSPFRVSFSQQDCFQRGKDISIPPMAPGRDFKMDNVGRAEDQSATPPHTLAHVLWKSTPINSLMLTSPPPARRHAQVALPVPFPAGGEGHPRLGRAPRHRQAAAVPGVFRGSRRVGPDGARGNTHTRPISSDHRSIFHGNCFKRNALVLSSIPTRRQFATAEEVIREDPTGRGAVVFFLANRTSEGRANKTQKPAPRPLPF